MPMKALVVVAFALFATACVPITAEPAATHCFHGYLSIRPGQSAEDPPSDNLPDYIDIVGVDSSLEGETLTAVFHLRGIPEGLTVNRDGVKHLHLEYSWSVAIDVESDPDADLSSYAHYPSDYSLGAFSPSMRFQSDTPPATLPFGDSFQTAVWEHRRDPQREVTQLMPLPADVRLNVSREDNALTLIGEVPGITPQSLLMFSTFDILHGQDGVSCPPGAASSQRDSDANRTAAGQAVADDASDITGLEEGRRIPWVVETPLFGQCNSDTTRIRPGQSVTDDASDELPAHIDVIEVNTALSGETLTVVFHLRDVPDSLQFNRTCVREAMLEYLWQASIDVDGDMETGLNGFDYTLTASHFVVPPSSSGSNSDAPIEARVQTNTWKVDPSGGGDYLESAGIEVSAQANTITLVGDIPGITSESLLAFETYDYLNGYEKVACRTPSSGAAR